MSIMPDENVIAALYSHPFDLALTALRARRKQIDQLITLIEAERAQGAGGGFGSPSLIDEDDAAATPDQAAAPSI